MLVALCKIHIFAKKWTPLMLTYERGGVISDLILWTSLCLCHFSIIHRRISATVSSNGLIEYGHGSNKTTPSPFIYNSVPLTMVRSVIIIMILIYILLTVLRDVVIVENTDPRDAIEYIMLDLRRVSDELDILSSSLDQLFHRRFIVKLQMDYWCVDTDSLCRR